MIVLNDNIYIIDLFNAIYKQNRLKNIKKFRSKQTLK
jgi:hypothetical protein